jgi:hypothetical protein
MSEDPTAVICHSRRNYTFHAKKKGNIFILIIIGLFKLLTYISNAYRKVLFHQKAGDENYVSRRA